MASDAPRISCLHLDTFFVSVERVLNPSLNTKPVILGGRPGSGGRVRACSREVHKLGVHTGMSLQDAGRLAPDAVYLPGRQGMYARFAAQVHQIAARYCPQLRVADLDELHMDLGECAPAQGGHWDDSADAAMVRLVGALRDTIERELGLPSSAGIATNTSMAKLASGLAKPSGVLLVPSGQEARLLAPLPVRRLPSIDPVAEAKLARIGITRLGEVADTPMPMLRPIFGPNAEQVRREARGQGPAKLGLGSLRNHKSPTASRPGLVYSERSTSGTWPGAGRSRIHGRQ